MSGKKKILLWGAGIVVLGVLIFFGTRKKTGGATAVETQRVARGEIVQKVNATGTVQPALEVNISANVSGEILDIGVREGDEVGKKQFLVQLDKEKYQAAYERANSLAASAAADVKLTTSELKRIRELHQKGLASEAELERAQASLEKAESLLKQQQAALKQARDDLSKTRITAPIPGTVTRLEKEIGEISLGSTFQKDVIMTIADLTTMEVIVEVDESDVIDVALGDSVEVEVEALPDTTFTGRVTEISHSAVTKGQGTQEQVTNFEVTVTLDTPARELRPGMSADVAIVSAISKNALVVPIRAVTVREPKRLEEKASESVENQKENPGQGEADEAPGIPPTTGTARNRTEMDEVVFVVGEDMTVEQRTVKTGISSDTHFEILSGLGEDEEIVVGSFKAVSKDLKDGATVEREEGAEMETDNEAV